MPKENDIVPLPLAETFPILWPLISSSGILRQQNRTKKWVTDITSIPTAQGWLYLAVILDLYSRAVVGWSMSGCCNEEMVARAFQMALLRRDPLPLLWSM